jgi:DNA-binding transcriptional MocR family regulator
MSSSGAGASSRNVGIAIATTASALAAASALALFYRSSRSSSKAARKDGVRRTLQELVRPNILDLTPYRCARDDYSSGVLLDANENSYGAAVPQQTLEFDLNSLELNRYPDPYQLSVKTLLGNLRGVKPEQIFVGVGSDEAIDLLIRIFCAPGTDAILITPPTYGMYKVRQCPLHMSYASHAAQ